MNLIEIVTTRGIHNLNSQLIKGITAIVALSGFFVFENTTSAQAKNGYKIVKTKNYATRTPFYNKGNAYMWNASHTKKILNMKSHPNSQWYRARSVVMKHGNKKAVYYKMVLGNKKITDWNGYVWRGNLSKGYGPNYVGHYQTKYYKLNQDTPITELAGSTEREITIPNGTIVRGTTMVLKQKTMISFQLDRLSYDLKNQLGITTSNPHMKAMLYSKKDLNPIPPSNLSVISVPNYIIQPSKNLRSTDADNNLYAGKTSTSWLEKLPFLRTTTDGLVEYYGDATTSVPTASQKIINSSLSGNTLTLYYADHMAGLNDVEVMINGSKEFKLVIQNLDTSVKVYDRNSSTGKVIGWNSYGQFNVGGSTFHNLDSRAAYGPDGFD